MILVYHSDMNRLNNDKYYQMKFRTWLENESEIIKVPLGEILAFRKAVVQAFGDFKQGRESRTIGPVHIWKTEDNKYQLVDGYHRFIYAIIHQYKTIDCEIIGSGYSDYWSITKPEDQFHYKTSMTYKDLENLADEELLRDLGH